MAAENKGTPQYFLNTFLRNPMTSIPKGAQWAIVFEDLKDLLPAINLAYELEPIPWQTRESAGKVLARKFHENRGCLFCTAIDIPGEGGNPVVEGNIKSNSLIRSYVGAGRSDFPIMRMSFIDTNLSFTESFLRGWSLATAAFGMIARDVTDAKNYRTDLTCYKFALTPKGPTVTQTYTFYDICCINVGNEEYNYDATSAMPKREANFVYNYYTLNTDRENNILTANTNPFNGTLRDAEAAMAREAAAVEAMKERLAARAIGSIITPDTRREVEAREMLKLRKKLSDQAAAIDPGADGF